MSLREDLARDIHYAGVSDPELLAEFLISKGWSKHRESFIGGMVSTVNAVNSIQASTLRPWIREGITQ